MANNPYDGQEAVVRVAPCLQDCLDGVAFDAAVRNGEDGVCYRPVTLQAQAKADNQLTLQLGSSLSQDQLSLLLPGKCLLESRVQHCYLMWEQ